MNEFVDLYCERCGPELTAEPLNTITNLSFFVAAWGIWKLIAPWRAAPIQYQILCSLTIAIGIGSSMFHAFATRWSQMLDVVPIFAFEFVTIAFYLRYVARTGIAAITIILVLFGLASFLMSPWQRSLNGSLMYAPAVIALAALGSYHYCYCRKERSILLIASGIFLVSLGFRTVDMSICDQFTHGTHFMWHLLNGAVVYLTSRSIVVGSSLACLPEPSKHAVSASDDA